jgi:hypothetical protein
MNNHNPGWPISPTELLGLAKARRFTTKAAALDYLDNEELECLVCGKAFVNLGAHLFKHHGVTAREYKVAFNLPRKMGLITPSVRAKLQAAVFRDQANLDRVREMGLRYGPINGHAGDHHANVPSYTDVSLNHKPVVNGCVKPKVRVERVLDQMLEITGKPIELPSAESLAALFGGPCPQQPERFPPSLHEYDPNSLVARVERIEKTLRIIRFALEEHLK